MHVFHILAELTTPSGYRSKNCSSVRISPSYSPIKEPREMGTEANAPFPLPSFVGRTWEKIFDSFCVHNATNGRPMDANLTTTTSEDWKVCEGPV